MTLAAWQAYRRKWAREHPHYNRDWMRKRRSNARRVNVMILGVKVKWRYLGATHDAN